MLAVGKRNDIGRNGILKQEERDRVLEPERLKKPQLFGGLKVEFGQRSAAIDLYRTGALYGFELFGDIGAEPFSERVYVFAPHRETRRKLVSAVLLHKIRTMSQRFHKAQPPYTAAGALGGFAVK